MGPSAFHRVGCPWQTEGVNHPHPSESVRPDAPFDHGTFWNAYARAWEEAPPEVRGAAKDAVLGEEWGPNAVALQNIERFVRPYLPANARAVEIGPGGGKYSRHLSKLVSELILVDVSAEMLERGRRVCGPNTQVLQIDGKSLQPLPDASFDAVMSFDVFVHLESEEIFRYFAESNRILKPGGALVLTTVNPLALFGGLGYYRQIRDRHPVIGQRYGGRLYPMESRVFTWMAEHSGFELRDLHEHWEDSQIVATFVKTGGAWLWRCMADPKLRAAFELGGRVGGTSRRPIFQGSSLATGEPAVIMVEDSPGASVAAETSGLALTLVPRPGIDMTISGTRVRAHPRLRGLCATRLESSGLLKDAPLRPFHFEARALAREVAVAVGAGLVAPEFGPESLFVDVDHQRFLALGFEAVRDADDAARAATRQGLGRALRDLGRFLPLGQSVFDLATRLASDGHPDTLRRLAVG